MQSSVLNYYITSISSILHSWYREEAGDLGAFLIIK